MFALLKTRPPSWYDYTMRSSESVIAATRGVPTRSFVNPIVALYRVDRSLSNGQYSSDKPDGPYTGSLLYISP